MSINSTPPLNTGVLVDVVSALLSAANSARACLTIVNTGAYNVYISKGKDDAVVGQGTMLAANGGSLTYNDTQDWKGPIQAIADGGQSQVTVCEEYI